MIKKVLSLILIGIVFSFAAAGQSEELVPQKDTLQQIIDLMVENNPALQSQRSLLEQIRALPNPGKGFDFQLILNGGISSYMDQDKREIWTAPTWGVGIEIPLFSLSRRKERIMDRLTYAKELETIEQDYLRLENSIISELLSKINELYQWENKEENLKELKSFLETRKDSLEEQVRTGMKESAALFDLMERVMQVDLEIKNTISELEVLKLETAINLGGKEWKELLELIKQMKE